MGSRIYWPGGSDEPANITEKEWARGWDKNLPSGSILKTKNMFQDGGTGYLDQMLLRCGRLLCLKIFCWNLVLHSRRSYVTLMRDVWCSDEAKGRLKWDQNRGKY